MELVAVVIVPPEWNSQFLIFLRIVQAAAKAKGTLSRIQIVYLL